MKSRVYSYEKIQLTSCVYLFCFLSFFFTHINCYCILMIIINSGSIILVLFICSFYCLLYKRWTMREYWQFVLLKKSIL